MQLAISSKLKAAGLRCSHTQMWAVCRTSGNLVKSIKLIYQVDWTVWQATYICSRVQSILFL